MAKGLKQAAPGSSQILLLPRVLEQAGDSDLGLALLIFTNGGRTCRQDQSGHCLSFGLIIFRWGRSQGVLCWSSPRRDCDLWGQGMARASAGLALVIHWRSSCDILDELWEQWGGLCLSCAITALVHGTGMGTHGLEVVIFPIPWYQMTPKYILMHELLPVSERPLCFQQVQDACLGSL